MYTRKYFADGSSHALETEYFDVRDLEEGETYVSNLTAEDLTGEEIVLILQEDAESGNYHSMISAYSWTYKTLVDAAGPNTAKAFMLKLLERGGFPG